VSLDIYRLQQHKTAQFHHISGVRIFFDPVHHRIIAVFLRSAIASDGEFGKVGGESEAMSTVAEFVHTPLQADVRFNHS